MLELVNIEKSFEYPVLKKISYTFEEGKVYVIKGVSGCGKSTLLNIIGGLDREYSGSLHIDGKPLKQMNAKEFKRYSEGVSYVFQNSLLISKLTVRENLLFIKQDHRKIECYAKKLGVFELLDKYPEQLSGGQRQRISLIRAMLNEPRIIIADEPTASLDYENSVKITKLIRELTDTECITIIATHEDCFDEIADQIIMLNYGRVNTIKKSTPNVQKVKKKEIEEKEIQKSGKSLFWKYVFKRNKEKYKLLKLLPMSIAFLIFLLVLSLQNNFQGLYINRVLKSYPANVFHVSNETYKELQPQYEIEKWDNYTFDLDGVGVYPLFDKMDSGIAYGNMIQCGRFPMSKNEIIVSESYVKDVMGMQNTQQVLGEQVLLGKEAFEIVGVLSEKKIEEESQLFYSNVYYKEWNDVSVFVPYETLKRIGTKLEQTDVMVKINGLYSQQKTYRGLREYIGGPINEWDDMLLQMQYSVDSIFIVILAGIAVLGLIAVIFIRNEVQLELYYRRKELGYLQIFNMPKAKVLRMVVFERSARSILSMLLSLLIYFAMATVIYVTTRYSILIRPDIFVSSVLIIFIYVVAVTWFPCKRFLRNDVIQLILS